MTYENKFGDHSFKAMAGANVEDGEYLYLGAKRSGVYNFDLPELNLANGDQSIVFLSSGNHTWWSIAGFFGRLIMHIKINTCWR
jgi:hypothetical protein